MQLPWVSVSKSGQVKKGRLHNSPCWAAHSGIHASPPGPKEHRLRGNAMVASGGG